MDNWSTSFQRFLPFHISLPLNAMLSGDNYQYLIHWQDTARVRIELPPKMEVRHPPRLYICFGHFTCLVCALVTEDEKAGAGKNITLFQAAREPL